jgi:hypothetical protein
MGMRLFGPRKDDIIGTWRQLHNGELHNCNSSPNVITVTESSYVTHMCGKSRANGIFVVKYEGERPLGRP